jgi:hypothetical protein
MQNNNWKEVVAKKRQQQADIISTFVSTDLLDIEEQQSYYNTITDVDDVAVLAQKIASGQFLSGDVAKAYISRNVQS